MPISDFYSNRTERLAVTIITCEPSKRTIEAVGKDADVKWIQVNGAPAGFRWPQVGEIWSIYRDGVYWQLDSLVADAEDGLKISDISPGQTLLGQDVVADRISATLIDAQTLTINGLPPNFGIDGTQIYTGASAPSNMLGQNGDFYIEDPGTDPKLYGPKAAGAWGGFISLVGPAATLPPVVTSLPGSPINGDEIYYQAQVGVLWGLRWDTATSKWQWVGGSNMTDEIGLSALIAANPGAGSWFALDSDDPQLTVPFTGVYEVVSIVSMLASNACTFSQGLQINGSNPATLDSVDSAGGFISVASGRTTITYRSPKKSLTAGHLVRQVYWANPSVNTNWTRFNASLSIRPVTIP